MSGDDPPFIPYGKPPICFRWEFIPRVVHNIVCFAFLLILLGLVYFCFGGERSRRGWGGGGGVL